MSSIKLFESAEIRPSARATSQPTLVLQKGHRGFHGECVVTCSADGRYAASGGSDGILIWDIMTGCCLHRLNGHKSDVLSATYSPQRCLIASGSSDHTVKIWNADTGECVRTLAGHENSVSSVTYSPNGCFIASGSWDNTVRVWDMATGRCRNILKGHKESIESVAYSPDGRLIASGDGDDVLRIWDSATGECLKVIHGSGSTVIFSPDGTSLITGGGRKKIVRILSAESFKIVHSYGAEEEVDYISVACSSDGSRIITGCTDGKVRIINFVTGELLSTLAGHEGYIASVACTPDDAFIVSADSNNAIRLWDATSGKCLHVIEGSKDHVTSVAYSPDSCSIASGIWEQGLRIWDTAASMFKPISGRKTTYIDSLVYSLNGHYLAATNRDKVQIRDVATGKCLQTIKGLEYEISSAAFSADSSSLAVAEYKTVRMYNIGSGENVLTITHQDGVKLLACSPDGRHLATGDGLGKVMIWDVATGACISMLAEHDGTLFSLAYSPCGTYIVSGRYKVMCVWDATTGECLRTMESHDFFVASVTYSHDSRFILSAGPESVKVWDATTGKCLRVLDGFENQISSATYSTDGRFIAVADYETVRFYDSATGSFQATLIGLTGSHWAVMASDGRYDSSDVGNCPYLRWTVLNKSYPVAEFKSLYYTPNLLGQIIHG